MPGGGRARPRFVHRPWGISSIGRVRALQARGTGIETRILHPFAHEQRQVGRVVKAVDSKSTGLRPRRFESCTCRSYLFAALAQLGERQTEDLKVPGSIPGGGIFERVKPSECSSSTQ